MSRIIMPRIIATQGLPASGKTTWATAFIKERQGDAMPREEWARVNKDTLRLMLHAGVYSKDNEVLVRGARDQLIAWFIRQGVSVVVDDTNFGQNLADMRALADRLSVELEVKRFTDVSVEECIERDARRLPRVGEYVIVEMARKHHEELEMA